MSNEPVLWTFYINQAQHKPSARAINISLNSRRRFMLFLVTLKRLRI
jgi:hypothetical protein